MTGKKKKEKQNFGPSSSSTTSASTYSVQNFFINIFQNSYPFKHSILMEYRNISKDIKTCDFNLPIPSKPIGFLVYSTKGFRAIARKITSRFVVLEIGSSYGVATEILSRRTKFVLGLETSSECIKEARSRYPHIQFEHIDCLGSPSIVKEKLCGMIANFVAADPVGENPRIVIFVDIGGNRESGALQKLLKFVETDLDPTYVVVKSQSLVQITPQETNVLKLGDLKQPVKKGKHKAHPLKQVSERSEQPRDGSREMAALLHSVIFNSIVFVSLNCAYKLASLGGSPHE